MKRAFKWFLSQVFFLVWNLRRALYRLGVIRAHHCGRPVISIGNLSMGGSGKTPWTDFLLFRLKERGLQAAVVSRGYKAKNRNIRLVPTDEDVLNDPSIFGDEPSWLARRHPDTPIYIGPKKWRTAQVAAQHSPQPHVLVVDDGFQHWRLQRNWNILLIDASEKPGSEVMFPMGRAREPFSEVRRASHIVLTKVNIAEPEHLEYWRDRIRRAWGRDRAQIVEASYELGTLRPLHGIDAGANIDPRTSVVLVSGIAGPFRFEKLVRDQKYNVARHFIYSDHYHFPVKETQKIEDWCREHNQTHVIVTEKDAIKLKGWRPTGLSVWVCELTVRIQKGQESIDEIIRQVDALSAQ